MANKLVSHSLGLGCGTLIENTQTGTVQYRANGKRNPAFEVRISDVSAVTWERAGVMSETVSLFGHGTLLVQIKKASVTLGPRLDKWFRERRDEPNEETQVGPASIADELVKLVTLRGAGALNDEEFQKAKARLLG